MAGSYDPQRVRQGYDAVADSYAEVFGNELDELPLDAALIDRIAASATGPVLELGAGVAPAARRLVSHQVVCCDLSGRMLAHAPRRAGRVQGDAAALPFGSAVFSAAVLRYVLQHIHRPRLPEVLAEVRRCLCVGGGLMVAVHLGEGEVEFTELLGERFEPIAGAFHSGQEIRALLDGAGFDVTEEHRRGPVGAEASTDRLYVLARARRAPHDPAPHMHKHPSS